MSLPGVPEAPKWTHTGIAVMLEAVRGLVNDFCLLPVPSGVRDVVSDQLPDSAIRLQKKTSDEHRPVAGGRARGLNVAMA